MNSKEIRAQLSPALQKLLDNVLSYSDGRPLEFVDEGKYAKITGKSPKLSAGEACFTGSEQRFIICLKSLELITPENELSIAHELGHLWLLLHGFPKEGQYADAERQDAYERCCGPLRDIMEHAIFYPWLNDNYKIDLYKRENQRLVDFIRNDLPKRKDQISLILNYIKFKIQTDEKYWQDRLNKAYSRTDLTGLKDKGESVLPSIQELVSKPPNSQLFVAKYCDALNALNIKREIWPDFCD